MISESQKKYVFENFTNAEQNFLIDSYLFGEAFLIDDFITYFDGVSLSIAAIPLGCINSINFNKIYNYFGSSKIETIKIFGYKKIIDKFTKDAAFKFKCSINYYKSHGKNEYVANTHSFSGAANRAYERGVSLGYELTMTDFEILTREQLFLFRQQFPKVCVNDACYWSLLPQIISRDDVVIANAYKRKKLAGFICFQQMPNGNYTSLMMARRKGYKYVYDFLYGACLKNKIFVNANIFLGHGETSGTEQFKKKWGDPIIQDIIQGTIYSRKETAGDVSGKAIWWYEQALQFATKK